MARNEGVEKATSGRKENPLREVGLGDLVREMSIMSHMGVPSEGHDNYKRYQSIVREINRREEGYTKYRGEPIVGSGR